MKPAADYRAALYGAYVSSGAAETDQRRALPTLRRQVMGHLPQGTNDVIFDLGCGNGQLVEMLVARGQQRVVGVDASTEQVAVAHDRGIGQVVQGDIREFLAGHPGEADAIVAVDLVEHLDRQEVFDLLLAVHRALKPGGRLVFRSPNASGPFGSHLRYADFTHQLAFTEESARQLLRAVGFADVEVYGTPPVAHGVRSAIRSVAWWCLERIARLWLLVETGTGGRRIVTQNLIVVACRPT